MDTECIKSEKKNSIVFYVFALFTVTLLYFFKMNKGFVGDEAFALVLGKMNTPAYYTSFVEQFTIMQMAGWFVAPFLWFFQLLTGGMTGIVLYMRAVWLQMSSKILHCEGADVFLD